jgi:hypothetical protein
MLAANSTSHGLVRDYVTAFGTLFNNIRIKRPGTSAAGTQLIAVPLSYAPKQRFIQRINHDLNYGQNVQIVLPRMSFEMTSLTYAPGRKLNTLNRTVKKIETTTGNNYVTGTYAPVPYDVGFSLNIYIKNIEDGTNIVEQILPYFTPEFTVTLKSATDLGLKLDLPVVLSAVNMEDNFEGSFEDRRIITWTLDFILKGMLYGATTSNKVIKKSIINLRPVTANSSVANTTTANNRSVIATAVAMNVASDGTATSTANSLDSVSISKIDANDPFGIATDLTLIIANSTLASVTSYN